MSNSPDGVSSHESAQQAKKDASTTALQAENVTDHGTAAAVDTSQNETPVDNTFSMETTAVNEDKGHCCATIPDTLPEAGDTTQDTSIQTVGGVTNTAENDGNLNIQVCDLGGEEIAAPHAVGGKQGLTAIITDSTENAPRKTQKTEDTEKWSYGRSIKLLGKIKNNIEKKVQQYVEEATATFDFGTLPPVPEEHDRAFGGSLVPPTTADPVTCFAFQQITNGLRNLKALAVATEFDQGVFLKEMTEAINGWEKFFSAQFTDEVKLMIKKMKALQLQLESGQPQEDTTDTLLATNEQVGVMLERAVLISDEISQFRSEVNQLKLAGAKRREELEVLEADCRGRIQELEAQLANLKEYLKTVQSSKEKLADFCSQERTVYEAINASSACLNQAVEKGNALSKELHQRLQPAAHKDGLPGPVEALRYLVTHYLLEE